MLEQIELSGHKKQEQVDEQKRQRGQSIQALWKKWFRKDNLIILILLGILLFIIALPTKKGGENAEGGPEEGGSLGAISDTIKSVSTEHEIVTESERGSESGQEESWLEKYAAEQEEKLKTLLSAVDGVGDVEVMLTFVSSEELVLEKDAPIVRSNTIEKDSEGGSRTVTQYERGDSTVCQSSSGVSEPYVIKTLNPRVEGVLVVAQGAGDGTINRSITEIVQALFGVEAHRVKVMPMGRELPMGKGLSTGEEISAGNAGENVQG